MPRNINQHLKKIRENLCAELENSYFYPGGVGWVAILAYLDHHRNDIFGPYFDKWAIGYKNIGNHVSLSCLVSKMFRKS